MPAAEPAAASHPPATATERRVLRDGTFNARDAGRYPADGPLGRMRDGVLYRADALANLTEADVAEAQRLGIRLVVDLRDPHERDNAPDLAIPGARNVSVMIFEGTLADHPAESYPSLPELYDFILTRHRHKLVEAVEHIAEAFPSPVLVHCTAGKDRTGLVIAMLQDLAGVPRQHILEDYEASQQLLTGEFVARVEGVYARARVDRRKIGADPTASPSELLASALERMREESGSVEAFLVQAGLRPESVVRIRRTLAH